MADEARPRKRVKEEEEEAEAEDTTVQNVTVEFKFRSCETRLVGEGMLEGTLHVPMIQDIKTGRFTVPAGRTEVTGMAKRRRKPEGEPFTAVFERTDADSPIEKLTLGYHLGLDHDDNVQAHLVNSSSLEEEKNKPQNSDAKYYEFQTYSDKVSERAQCQRRLNDWESNCGGMLTFFANGKIDAERVTPEYVDDPKQFVQATTWKADYKIKLYTVLSAHAPNEEVKKNKKKKGAQPDWVAPMKLLMARIPGADEYWVRRAVDNYRDFLDIKIKDKDWDSNKYSPSKAIDEVWHAHLSFTSRYQHDMLAYAYCGHIIEHSPVLGKQAEERYRHQAACDKHLKKKRDSRDKSGYKMGCFKEDYYDREFWPQPRKVGAQYEENHDGDSDDCCKFPSNSSCG